ncbi:hypothetical protein ACB098_06G217700 [Castanea mollissima]
MWALSQTTPSLPHHTIISPKLLLPLPLTISANSQPRRHQSKPPRNDAVPTKDIKGLGHTILEVTALNSTTPNPIPKQQQKQEGEGRQISGSDVLRALQRAAAQKNEFSRSKKMKSKKMKKSNTMGISSSVEEGSLDYSKVRPLRIKGEWGVRLVELEKRLQELSDTHS